MSMYNGRRAPKELDLPVLPGAWALGDGPDLQLLEQLCAQSPPHPRQSGNGSPSVWSSLLESLTGALNLSGDWEYSSRSDSNKQTASCSGASAGGRGAASSSTTCCRGASGIIDGFVVVSTRSAGGGLLHRSCPISSVVGRLPSVASVATPAAEAPALLGRANSGGGAAAVDTNMQHFDSLLRAASGGSSGAAATACTSTRGLLSTAASSGMGSAATTSSGMSTGNAGLSVSAGSSCTTTSASTPIIADVTFGYLASLPASGCADRDLIDSVLASPRGCGLRVPAQVSVCKQD